jgi:hypothetical protein
MRLVTDAAVWPSPAREDDDDEEEEEEEEEEDGGRRDITDTGDPSRSRVARPSSTA